ncbi:MAG: glycosyltransferase family 4 protein [Acidimicrobiales bacterium]
MTDASGDRLWPADAERLTIGYACAWWTPRETTWSYTAARLRDALAEHATVVDLEAQRSLIGKVAIRAVHAAIPGVPWQYSPVERVLKDRRIRRGVARSRLDAVLGIAEADALTTVPTFLYQDMNASCIANDSPTARHVNLLASRPSIFEAMARTQRERLRGARGVFAMSRWYAELLLGQGVRPDLVSVMPPGMNNPPTRYRDPSRPVRGDVLFVGTDFVRKGGDLVLDAVRQLNEAGDPVRLTIIGPREWPGPGPIPSWVEFRGFVEGAAVSSLMADHDVFAMPSRFEAFGIALVEAQVAGLPGLARNVCAMPEIVTDGVTGALVNGEGSEEVAGALRAILDDPGIHRRVAAQRPVLVRRHDWGEVAASMVDQVASALDGGKLP